VREPQTDLDIVESDMAFKKNLAEKFLSGWSALGSDWGQSLYSIWEAIETIALLCLGSD